MKAKLLALAICASTIAWSPAQAVDIPGGFELESGSFGTGYGVHSAGSQSGNILDAFVNQDGSGVTFSSPDGLQITGSGEATVYPLTGLLQNLQVNFAKAWEQVTFSFQGSGSFDLGVNGAAPAGCSICTIGNGLTKFTLSGGNISSLNFTFNPGIENAKQFRVEGVTAAVPEPATWALLFLGFGLIGGMMRSKRREQRLKISYS